MDTSDGCWEAVKARGVPIASTHVQQRIRNPAGLKILQVAWFRIFHFFLQRIMAFTLRSTMWPEESDGRPPHPPTNLSDKIVIRDKSQFGSGIQMKKKKAAPGSPPFGAGPDAASYPAFNSSKVNPWRPVPASDLPGPAACGIGPTASTDPFPRSATPGSRCTSRPQG